MPRGIFFCRHGAIGTDVLLSGRGRVQLAVTKSKLLKLGFNARRSISSPEPRCIESAVALTAGAAPVIVPELHAYGNFELVHLSGSGEKQKPSVYAHATFKLLIKFLMEDADVVVCAHDSIPVMLAYALMERMGGVSVTWNMTDVPHHLSMLYTGSGVLVRNRELTYIDSKT